MKIRGPSELVQALDESVAWRKREISSIHLLLSGPLGDHERSTLRRAAVPILYSHWEGFAKQAAEVYLELVSRQKLRYRELKTNFLAIACRATVNEAARARSASVCTQLVDFLVYNQDHRAKFSVGGAIDTESNLDSGVLRNLLLTIGLTLDSFWDGKYLLIDGSLLKNRNDIAHGAAAQIDQATYDQLHDLVLEMLDQVKTCIENAAVSRSYLRS